MSASNEVRFKISGDTSALSRAFVQAQSVAAAASTQIRKKFDLKEGFRSGVLALGLSIEKISENIAEMFTGGSQEAWKDALRSAEEASRIIEENTMKRMDNLRQIEQLEKEINRNATKEDAAPQKTGEPGTVRKVLDSIGENLFGTIGSLLEKAGAKTLGGEFAKSAENYRHRGENGDGMETPAEAAKRSQEATAQRLAKEARIEELKDRAAKNEERLAQGRRELARVTMTDEQRIVALGEDVEEDYRKIAAEKLKGHETTELEIAALNKSKQLEEMILKFQKDQTAETEKQAQKREQALQKYREYLDAQDAVTEAHQGVRDAHRDALALTVDEAAKGKRGTSADRSKARAIRRDEARAVALFGTGHTVTEFDAMTQRNQQRGAAFFQSRAEQMRKGFDRLRTDEQKPFAAVEKKLDDANEHLKKMEAALMPKPVK